MNIEAMKLWLKALETSWYHVGTFCPTDAAIELYDEARDSLRQAIEQAQKQEPVEWMTFIPLYTAPPVASNDTSQERVDETAKQRHEPMAWMNKHGACMSAVFKEVDATAGEYTTPLYTLPQPRQWVGLTDEEIDNINYTSAHMLACEVEAKLKEKNT